MRLSLKRKFQKANACDAAKQVEPDSAVSVFPEFEASPEAAVWVSNRIGTDLDKMP